MKEHLQEKEIPMTNAEIELLVQKVVKETLEETLKSLGLTTKEAVEELYTIKRVTQIFRKISDTITYGLISLFFTVVIFFVMMFSGKNASEVYSLFK